MRFCMTDVLPPAPSSEILYPPPLTITSTSIIASMIPNPNPQPPKSHTSFILHDPLSPHPMLCIHTDDDDRNGYENRREGRASRDHEHDDHLQFSGLLDGRAT